jgi:hypothetical protein
MGGVDVVRMGTSTARMLWMLWLAGLASEAAGAGLGEGRWSMEWSVAWVSLLWFPNQGRFGGWGKLGPIGEEMLVFRWFL